MEMIPACGKGKVLGDKTDENALEATKYTCPPAIAFALKPRA